MRLNKYEKKIVTFTIENFKGDTVKEFKNNIYKTFFLNVDWDTWFAINNSTMLVYIRYENEYIHYRVYENTEKESGINRKTISGGCLKWDDIFKDGSVIKYKRKMKIRELNI